MNFAVYARAAGRGGANPQVLVGSRDCIDYVGSTTGPEYTTVQPCSYAVGVYDRATRKLQVLPIRGGRVCRMEARVRGLDYGPRAPAGSGSGAAAAPATTREERLALSKRLVGSFGSTRRRRQMDAREEGIVGADKLADTGVLTKLLAERAAEASAAGLTREAVLARAAAVRHLPPHHLEATNAESAYVLDEIIPAGGAASLDVDRLLKAAKSGDASKMGLPKYVADRVFLLNDPIKAKARPRGLALSLLACLLSLFSGRPDLRIDPERAGGLDALASRMRVAPPLLRDLLELFYNHRREGNVDVYERPAAKRELLIAYVLVLAVLADGSGLLAPQFEALRAELRMSAADLVQRFREIGATCTSTSIKLEGSDGKPTRTYNVMLLQNGKTLGESLPGIKIGPKRK